MKTILVDAWNTFITQKGIHKEMQVLLDSFSNPKIIVTNANETERQDFGIVNMPYPVFSLAHTPNKTDPQYFSQLMESFSLTANELIYFEHNQEAVACAQSHGITTFWYHQNSSNLAALEIFLKESI